MGVSSVHVLLLVILSFWVHMKCHGFLGTPLRSPKRPILGSTARLWLGGPDQQGEPRLGIAASLRDPEGPSTSMS